MTLRRILLVLAVAAAAFAVAPAAQAATLRAGVGKADITPRTGYYLGGWTRADRVSGGQHTRLFSRALVLRRGSRKVAMVQVDLFMVPGGMVRQIGDALASRGFSERNILISASHTHSGPGGFANFPTLNTTAPSLQTVRDPFSFARLLKPDAADPALYTFLVHQIAAGIRRADSDLAPAEAGWGSARLLGITRNRSIEAHLADHGLQLERGQGREAQDPGGYPHTIDPDVNVLRVDKLVRVKGRRKRRRVPIGGWSTFADHGTVTKSSFPFYNADHHASAERVFEQGVRRRGKVARRQDVINVYGNSNEGDQSAGLTRSGPAASDYVGRVEAAAMLRAWGSARKKLSRTPLIDTRWTRMCFCGQVVDGRQVASESQVGLPFLTGSEEERGPLYDITHQHFEGKRKAADLGDPHGYKLSAPGVGAGVPHAVPLLAMRIGPRLVVSLPGEGTKEVGARIRAAATAAVRGSSIDRVVLSGLANEFILYLTTPEEYDRQHYEGGNTQFGRESSVLVQNSITRLAGTLAHGQAAPPAFPFDPTNGVRPTGPGYGSGAASASDPAQPVGSYRRLRRATFSWDGGALGLDRPVDRAFVTAQRRDRRGHWRSFDSDLGLSMLWTVSAGGRYQVRWEIPLSAPRGTYRLLVTAKRYRIASRTFRVGATDELRVVPVPARRGRVAVALRYPGAVTNVDLTHRPEFAAGGRVRFRVGSRTVTVKRKRSRFFSVRAPAGRAVSVAASAGRDRFGNRNGTSRALR